jgi:hypothetical protein
MSGPKATYEELEEKLPSYALEAVRRAYRNTMRVAGFVIKVQNGHLVKAYRDGKSEIIKKLPEPTKVKVGQRIRIR